MLRKCFNINNPTINRIAFAGRPLSKQYNGTMGRTNLQTVANQLYWLKCKLDVFGLTYPLNLKKTLLWLVSFFFDSIIYLQDL